MNTLSNEEIGDLYRLEQAREILESCGYVLFDETTGAYVNPSRLSLKQIKRLKSERRKNGLYSRRVKFHIKTE